MINGDLWRLTVINGDLLQTVFNSISCTGNYPESALMTLQVYLVMCRCSVMGWQVAFVTVGCYVSSYQ